MILILSPIPQILFYKKREQQDKIAPVALVFNTKYVIGSGSDKIILLCQGQFLIGE